MLPALEVRTCTEALLGSLTCFFLDFDSMLQGCQPGYGCSQEHYASSPCNMLSKSKNKLEHVHDNMYRAGLMLHWPTTRWNSSELLTELEEKRMDSQFHWALPPGSLMRFLLLLCWCLQTKNNTRTQNGNAVEVRYGTPYIHTGVAACRLVFSLNCDCFTIVGSTSSVYKNFVTFFQRCF